MEIGVLRKILKRWKLWSALSEHYKALPEPKDIGRALSPSEESRLFAVASCRPEWTVAFCASLIAASTTAGGCELRNLRLRDTDLSTRTLFVKVGKNRFRGSGNSTESNRNLGSDAIGGEGCTARFCLS